MVNIASLSIPEIVYAEKGSRRIEKKKIPEVHKNSLTRDKERVRLFLLFDGDEGRFYE